MAFYDLSKSERIKLVNNITSEIQYDLTIYKNDKIIHYFSDEDTYIRKSGYLAIGKIYKTEENLQKPIIEVLNNLLQYSDEKIRQTVINAAGEIGKTHFENIENIIDVGLFDEHHSVRNAVIGSMKKMGEKNHIPILNWSKKYLKHPDKEIRREICHGLELRGRTHPQDILPLLKILEFDTTKRVSNTLIHVLGQIAYKKDCLETVVSDLKTWKNKELVEKALDEIVDVHRRYEKFSILTQQQAIDYIDKNYIA